MALVVLANPRWTSAAVVDIPDPELRRVINIALGKSEGAEVTDEEIGSLESLDASRAARGMDRPLLENLEGLEHASNLLTLDLSGFDRQNTSDIQNLSEIDLLVLESLPNLRELNLASNSLWDEISLYELRLPKLEKLDLSGNRLILSDFLDGFEGLRELILDRNRFEELTFNKGMGDLEVLSLDGLSNLIHLEFSGPFPFLKELGISTFRRLALLSLPDQLPALEILEISTSSRAPIEHLELPAELPLLRELSIGPLPEQLQLDLPTSLPALRSLSLSPIRGRIPVVDLQNSLELEAVSLFVKSIGSLKFPQKAEQLRRLVVSVEFLAPVSIPEEMPRLETLSIHSTDVKELTLPSRLPVLNALSIKGNALESLDLGDDLRGVEWLFLRGNQLRELRLPERIDSLLGIDLLENPIERLEVPAFLDLDPFILAGLDKSKVVRYDTTASMLTISVVEGGKFEIHWAGGSLQRSGAVAGPWRDVGSKESPLSLELDGSSSIGFFRVVPKRE